jgi:hypothetical protein
MRLNNEEMIREIELRLEVEKTFSKKIKLKNLIQEIKNLDKN